MDGYFDCGAEGNLLNYGVDSVEPESSDGPPACCILNYVYPHELTARIESLRAHEELIEEAKAEAETLRDSIKQEMLNRDTEEHSMEDQTKALIAYDCNVARQDPNFREGRPRKYTACQLHHTIDSSI